MCLPPVTPELLTWAKPLRISAISIIEKLKRKDGEPEVRLSYYKSMTHLTFSQVRACTAVDSQHSLHMQTSFLNSSTHVTPDTPGTGVQHAVDLCAAPGSWSQVLLLQTAYLQPCWQHAADIIDMLCSAGAQQETVPACSPSWQVLAEA